MANLQISGCLVDLWGDLWYNICRKSCLARLSALPLRAGHGCDIESRRKECQCKYYLHEANIFASWYNKEQQAVLGKKAFQPFG